MCVCACLGEKTSCPCHVECFCRTAPLDMDVGVPAESCTPPCVCPSLHLQLSPRRFSSITSFSPLQLHFLFFSYPPPFRFMLVSIPVFQYLHFKFHEANAVRLSSLGCLSVFSSSPHRFSQSLAARLFLFLSLCTSLSASSSHSPHLSLSAVLHLSINRPKCLVSSDGFSFKSACSFPLFHFLHLHVLLSLMVCLSELLLRSRLIAPDSLSSRVTCLHLISVRVRRFRGFSLLRLPLTCTGGG